MTKKITDLTEVTQTEDGDLLLIRDATDGVDKKMQAQNLRAKATTKADVGLGNVDNVSATDLRDRSTHTGTQAATTVTYDNTVSGLSSADVKSAIDEIVDNAKVKKYFYTATASQTTFAGADDFGAVLAYSSDSLDVFINGVRLSNADYNADDEASVVLNTGAKANDEVAIVTYGFVLGGSGAKTFAATVTGSNGTSDWAGSDPYIATITVSGILSTDIPSVDLDMSNVAFADVPDIVGEFGLVYRIEASADDEIKLYATAEPTQDFDLTIQVIR